MATTRNRTASSTLKRPAMPDLLELADEVARTRRMANPPDPLDKVAAVHRLCIEVKSRGGKISKWSEKRWIAAMRKFGFDDEDAACMLEDVASWGVDD